MYLMNCTRPDIAYAVGRLSRYTQSPNQDHWTAVRRVLKHLKGTINYGLCFSGFPSVLEGFSDANWISDSNEMKSTSGYVFILGGSAVSWKSAKQTCITYQATIAKAKSKIFNGKNKHIRLRHNIVWQLLEIGVISLEFVRLELNLADPLTKPLNKKLVEETSRGWGLYRAYSALTKVECLLLMNTIFLMDGIVRLIKTVHIYSNCQACSDLGGTQAIGKECIILFNMVLISINEELYVVDAGHQPLVLDFFRGRKLNDALLMKMKIVLLTVHAVINDAEEKQITNPAVKEWLDELKDAVYDAEDLLDEMATEVLKSQMEAESKIPINQDYCSWDLLRGALRFGASGSKIIATMRSKKVSSIMHPIHTHHLELLSYEDSWLLFAKHAFSNEDACAHPTLKAIGEKIVEKCNGLPLAAKTIGGLLKSETDTKDWYQVLNTLRLSYHYLPAHLKPCFAYCSLFHKNYEFDKETLVRLWIAEGFVQQPKAEERIEVVGNGYFTDLLSRSLFQQSGGNESRFIMHELVNGLAKFVSGEFSFSLEDENQQKISQKTRHMSYFRGKYDASRKFRLLYETKRLRTFLPLNLPPHNDRCYLSTQIIFDLVPMLRCLRVLSLSHYKITELSDSIGNLRKLAYLDLSYTGLRNLPDSTCNLYNLQTLLLSNCCSLSELPANMGKLINLRHLDISQTNVKEMPTQIGRLGSLQTLSTFVVGKHSGARIKELGLQNVVLTMDAHEANLEGKEHLDALALEWSDDTDDSQNERVVLENLKPHSKLKELSIKFYGGTRFPDWLGDPSFSNLLVLCLSDCKYCLSLPPLGQLPSLEKLYIVGANSVKKVGLEFYGHGSSSCKPFGSLKTLVFEKMMEWEEWFISASDGKEFPSLQELYIVRCPKLIGRLPSHLPCLTRLEITECEKLVASLPVVPAIRYMWLSKCDEMVIDQRSDDAELTLQSSFMHMPTHSSFTCPSDGDPVGLKHLSDLETLCISRMMCRNTCLVHLTISNCPSLVSFPMGCGGLLTTLKVLYIHNCRKLELPLSEEMIQPQYSSLETLKIERSCDSLRCFPLGFFTKLIHLHIEKCRHLEFLSVLEGLHHGGLTALEAFYILKCPEFRSFPRGGLPTPNLRWFGVYYCKKLKSLPNQMHTLLTSLQSFEIFDCPQLLSFPEGGLPSSLSELSIWSCNKLMTCRTEWGLQRLASLKHFSISEGCEGDWGVESFLEELQLPSTLTSLRIYNFGNLKSIDKGLRHLTSLKKLKLFNCPELRSLPEVEALPPSLSFLNIQECPLINLAKIAQVPFVKIDDQLIG
ncbi:hypothetical protein AAG906_022149 [Vitis piasezkii]